MDLAEICISSSHRIIKYFRLEGISGGPKPRSKQRAPNWTRYSRYGLTSAEKRERISTLFKLMTFLLIQPSMQLAFRVARPHCRALFNMFSMSSPRSFFCEAAFYPVGPQPALLHGLIPSWARTPCLPLLHLLRYLLPVYPARRAPSSE